MGGGEAPDRRPRPRALVHGRLPPCAARRGLARDARTLAWLSAPAVQLLRSQPRARCAAGRGGDEMRSACVLLAPMLIACFVPDISRAGEGAVASRASAEAAGALLYLDRAAWQRAYPVQRTT